MSCDRYRDALTDVAAGGRADPTAASHLERCAACRGELDARREALALADAEMAGLLASNPSPELPTRIRRAVAAQSGRGWWPSRPALAVAAALLIALGAFATWRAGPRSPLPESRPVTRLAPTPPEPGSEDPHAARVPRQPPAGPVRAEVAAAGPPPSDRLSAPEEPPRAESPPAPSAGSFAAEVLVPAGQEEALLRFAAGLHCRTVTPDSVLVAERAAPLNPPRPLHRVEIEMLTLDSSIGAGL